MSSRNDSASTFTVGWRLTNVLIAAAENIMMTTARTTAVTMIDDVLGHADRRDDRVEREDDVERHDLDDHRRKRRRDPGRPVALFAFETLVNLERGLAEQEEAADQKNQVAAGDLLAEHGEERCRQTG